MWITAIEAADGRVPAAKAFQPAMICVFVGWLVAVTLGGEVAVALDARDFALFFSHFGGVLFVGGLYLWSRRRGTSGPFLGQLSVKATGVAALAMAAIYLIALGIQKALSIPQEPLMAALFSGKQALEVLSILLTVLVLAPIGEEIALRHYLLGTIDWRRNRSMACAAVVFASAIFTALHLGQYENHLTTGILFVVGLVAGMLRVRSNGLALPIIAHSFAGASALLMNLFL